MTRPAAVPRAAPLPAVTVRPLATPTIVARSSGRPTAVAQEPRLTLGVRTPGDRFAAVGLWSVLSLGDSLAEGYGASVPANRWVNVAQDLLRDAHPTGENGTGGGYGFLPAYIGSAAYTPWTQTAGVTNDIGFGSILVGPGYRGVFVPNNATDTATVVGTTARIWHLDYGSLDPLEVRVDGVLVSSVDETGDLAFHDDWTDVPLGESGSHVVQVKGTGAGSYFDGAQIFDGDEAAGIQIFDAAHAGYLSSSYAIGLSGVNDFATDVADWVAGVDPAITTIMLGTNDWFFSVAPATYLSNMAALLADVQAAKPNMPVLLIASPTPDGAPSYPWSGYVAALESLTGPGVHLLDLSATMPDIGSPAGDASGFYADTLHFSDAGHAEVAAQVVEAFETIMAGGAERVTVTEYPGEDRVRVDLELWESELSVVAAAPADSGSLLLESGDDLLAESGDRIMLDA